MSSLLHINESLINHNDKQKFLDVHGVRLTPPFLEFKQAFEGKTYQQKLSIQNIGKTKVVVSITSPTSYAFKIRLVKSHQLSPGLVLVRKVTYVYSYVNFPSCIIPIYINGNRYDYHLRAIISAAEVDVIPKCIDFGSIDAGYTSPAHTLTLSNNGTRPVKFCINNFTYDDYTLIIDPCKGLLQAKSTILVSLKLLANTQGIMQIELWVKTDKPTMVLVQAEIIKPRFEPVGTGLSSTFCLVDFPVTYVGLTSTKSVYVRNFSASTSMFCIMGEVQHTIMGLDACREQANYKYFTPYPTFGMFQPKHIKAVHFKFQPQRPKRGSKPVTYYFCVFHICRIRAKFLTQEDYRKLLNSDTSSALTYSRFSWSTSSTNQQQSDLDHTSATSSAVLIQQTQYNIVRPAEESTCIKFYLHAIPEIPNVTIVPDELILSDLTPGQRETRVLQFQNLSKHLPIIVVYNKIAFVDVSETIMHITPMGSIQISVVVTPQNIGRINCKMHFDLVYYDFPREECDSYKVIGKLSVPIKFNVKAITKTPAPEINFGITPNYIKEAGKFCQDLQFDDTDVEKPKAAILQNELVKSSTTALMALPNETQRSVRPWRNQKKCKTLLKRMSRYVAPLNFDYEMTVHEQQFKSKLSNYYTTYRRTLAERAKLAIMPKREAQDYEITSDGKLLCTDLKLPSPTKGSTLHDANLVEYLPLLIDPVQIANIIITPQVIQIGMMAAHDKYEFTINIKNNNNITISIYVLCDKQNVLFPTGHRMMIKGYSEEDLLAIYSSGAVGFYTAELKLIINECAYVLVDVHANVCSVTLQLNTNRIVFEDQQTNHYVELINTLSSSVAFKWKLSHSNVSIEPNEGVVDSDRSLLCYLRHFPDVEGPSLSDAYITCTDKIIDQLRLCVKSDYSKVFFNNQKLVLSDMPLNIPITKTVLLYNDSSSSQCYTYVSDEFSGIIDVFPNRAVIYSHSFCVLTLVLTMKACVRFKAKLRFAILSGGFVDLYVSGNVVYPDVRISPTVLNFQKMPCSTWDTLKISVENRSAAQATVTFDLSMYPEYLITETNQYINATPVETVTLDDHSTLTLYFHFKPYATSSDKFFLPTIINGILGPTTNKIDSQDVTYFLTNNIPCSTLVNIPSQLNVVTVNTYAVEAKISISKLHIKLIYTPFSKKDKSSYNLRLANFQHEQDSFCIRTDDLKRPLYFTQLSGPKITRYTNSIVCSLKPQEEVVFQVSVRPHKYGKYSAVLPIFLRSDYSKRPHNNLVIEAEYGMPTISCSPRNVYLKPLPLRIHIVISKRFTFKNHFENCNVYCSCSLPNVELQFNERVQIDKTTEERWLLIKYYTEERICQLIGMSVYCSCGGTCTMRTYFTVENCFLTNYALVHTFIMHPEYNLELRRPSSVDTLRKLSLMSIVDNANKVREEYNLCEFFKSYPYFPDASDVTNENEDVFLEFMETAVTVMESWISTQAFFGTVYYKIPEGIRYVHPNNSDKPPFIELLLNMLGKAAEPYLQSDIPAKYGKKNLYHIMILHCIYKKAVALLVNLGAHFTCVHPAYLLPFEMYRDYATELAPQLDDEKFLIVEAASQFNRLSKQCWLDTILQTYKVVVLNKIIRPLDVLPIAYEMPNTPHQRYRQSIKNVVKNNHLFSTPELLLLNWLEFHFNSAKDAFWPDSTYPDYREFAHFGEILNDGYVYAAITLTFCPYLEDHFKKLSLQTIGQEHVLHNNILVIQSWDILNLNVGVTVTDLTNPHPIRTLLTIVYLFEVLPYFYPSESLELVTGLSTQTEHVLTLTNRNNFQVAYKVKMYGNDDGCFAICKDLYVINANSKRNIKVTYWAKFIKTAHATLILSGECRGYRFTRSKVISLCGKPDVSHVNASYDLSAEIYSFKECKLNVLSPYPVAATYRIQTTCNICNTSEDVERQSFRDELPQFCISRCVPLDTTFTCNKKGGGEITVCVCTSLPINILTWFYFRNKDVGDFAIKITAKATPLRRQDILQVELPFSFHNSESNEMIEAVLEIPCQYRLMWKTIIDMLLKLAVADIQVWKNVLYTTAGMHVMRSLLWITSGPYSDHKKMCESTTFNIKCHKKSKIILPETVHIEDRCSMGTVKVPIRFLRSNTPKSMSITLTSEDEIETRSYRIYFVERLGDDVIVEPIEET